MALDDTLDAERRRRKVVEVRHRTLVEGGGGGGTAATTTFTPAGNIAATNVQAAIEELDTEKVAKAGDTMTGALNVFRATTGRALDVDAFSGTTGTGIQGVRVVVDDGGTGAILTPNQGIRANVTTQGNGTGDESAFTGVLSGTPSNKPTSACFVGIASTGAPFLGGNITAAGGKAVQIGNTTAAHTGSMIDLTAMAGSTGNFLSGALSGTGERCFLGEDGSIGAYGAYVSGIGGVGKIANLLLHSEEFNEVEWVHTGITVTTDTTPNPFTTGTTGDTLTTTGAGTNTTKQTAAGTTASKTFRLSGWYRNAGSNWDVRIDSSNETGSATVLASTSGLWKFFTLSQTFTSGSTGAPVAVLSKAASGHVLDVWGFSLAESAAVVAYAKTRHNAVQPVSGVIVNGTLAGLGGIRRNVRNTSVSETAGLDDFSINVTTGATGKTETLPPATTEGMMLHITKADTGAGTVTVAAAGSDTVNFGASVVLATQGASVTLIADGISNWGRIALL